MAVSGRVAPAARQDVAPSMIPTNAYQAHRRAILGPNPSGLRQGVFDLVSSRFYARISLCVVVTNVFLIVLEYLVLDTNFGDFIGFLVFYTVETIMKLIAYRGGFFWDGFNVLDLILVGLRTGNVINSMAITYIRSIPEKTATMLSDTFLFLTSLNAMRVARLLRYVDNLRLQGRVLVYCLKYIIYIFFSLLIICYVYATFAVAYFPHLEAFPSIGIAMWNLVLLMTLDDWSSIFRPGGDDHPDGDFWPFLFAFSFILIQAIVLISLLSAMLLSTYLSEVKVTREEDLAADADHLLAGIRETNFGDVVENLGSVYSDNKEALLDASSLVASHIFYDGNESPPRDEDEALLQTYQRFQERWNQLIQLFLELTIIMNGNVYLLMETLQTA